MLISGARRIVRRTSPFTLKTIVGRSSGLCCTAFDMDAVRAELAPRGELRIGVNLSNTLLVSARGDNGGPVGVSPDIGKEVARQLQVSYTMVCYPSPGALADAVHAEEWDIGNIGAEPQRAQYIAFTGPYAEIAAAYLVAEGAKHLQDVDAPGIRIGAKARAAYCLWLERNVQRATLVQAPSHEECVEMFRRGELDVLAGLRSRLEQDVTSLKGAELLQDNFMAVQQAIGTPRKNAAAASWLASFVEEAKKSGLVAELIEKHNVHGLSVAP